MAKKKITDFQPINAKNLPRNYNALTLILLKLYGVIIAGIIM